MNQPPKFIIPTNDGEDGVEVKAKPWHEVQVQYALTDLGRPDGPGALHSPKGIIGYIYIDVYDIYMVYICMYMIYRCI